jgi:hypothetical protein
MSPEVATNLEFHRFVLCGGLTLVGALAIILGYVLFSRGAGLFKAVDKLAIKKDDFNVSITGMSAGGALMLTSVVWGFWAYSAVPTLELAGDLLKISSLPSGNNSIASIELPNWKVTGTNVYGANKQKIGTITGVLVDKDSNAKAFALDIIGRQDHVLVNAKDFTVTPNGSAPPLVVFQGNDEVMKSAIALNPETLD